jgi:hypothetical protein
MQNKKLRQYKLHQYYCKNHNAKLWAKSEREAVEIFCKHYYPNVEVTIIECDGHPMQSNVVHCWPACGRRSSKLPLCYICEGLPEDEGEHLVIWNEAHDGVYVVRDGQKVRD